MKWVNENDLGALQNSGSFDKEWYSQQYPEVKIVGLDPLKHYLWVGKKLGREPLMNIAKKLSDSHPEYKFLPNTQALNPNSIPHYGSAFYRIVQSAQDRTKELIETEEYAVIREVFDLPYYLMRYPDIAQAENLDPIQHYISHGSREGRDPSPDFSTKHYMHRYPEVKESGVNPYYHWLTIGRREGRIAVPFTEFEGICRMFNRSPIEVQSILSWKRHDLRHRFEHGVLGEMVAKATKLEPLIAHSWKEVFTAKFPPFHSDQVVTQTVAMQRMHEEADFRPAKAVVIIPHCRLSGGARLAGHLSNALAQIFGPEELVVLRTDLDIMRFPEWFPADCRHVSLANAAEKLPLPSREKLLVEFLRSLKPSVVINLNSRLFWETMRSYGKVLSASTSLYTYFFCNDKNNLGHWSGYPLRNFYRYFDLFKGVLTDSEFLADEFRTRYLVPPAQMSKIVALKTPVSFLSPAPLPVSRIGRKPCVFWAGRFDRQKRVDLVYRIASQMPDVDFRLWGEPVLDNHAASLEKPSNVHLEGVFALLSDLPFEQCDAWLYTSEWDGVPNMLIEIATLAVPLVGSIAGGTGEILKEELTGSVYDIEDIGGYEKALRAILADPTAARERAQRLRNLVLSQHTPEVYQRDLQATLSSGKSI